MLLSRSPLASTRRWVPFDLHVLGAPPAFILSQDRTLRPNKVYWARRARPASDVIADRIHSILVVIASSCWKGMTRLSPYHTLYSVHHCYHRNGIRSVSRRMHPRCSASQYPVLKVRAGGSSRCRAAGINNARAGGRRPRESASPHSVHNRGGTQPPKRLNGRIHPIPPTSCQYIYPHAPHSNCCSTNPCIASAEWCHGPHFSRRKEDP